MAEHTTPAEKRSRILQEIMRSPGISKTELCRATGLSWGTVGHHLHALSRSKQIRLHRLGKGLHAAPASYPRERTEAARVMRNEAARAILEALRTSSLGPSDIARRTELSERQVRKQLDQLSEAGFVRGDGQYHPRYSLTP